MADIAATSGDICGAIHLVARAEDGVITGVNVASSRPVQVARVFESAPVEQLCATIGRIFSLCGVAQTVAALTAAEAALGIAPAPGVQAARDLARLGEMLTQTVMRLSLFWPRAFGAGQLGGEMRPDLVRACLGVEEKIAAQALGAGWRVPGAGVQSTGGQGAAPALEAALAELDTLLQGEDPGAPLAAALHARGLEGYGALPAGHEPEQGALARQWHHESVVQARAAHGAGLAARLEAARAEVALLPLMMLDVVARVTPEPERAATRSSGAGQAVVETARGGLTHRLALEDGIVTACTIEAPTEANFAADGPAVRGLIGARADPLGAELHVLAIDPCVAASVDISSG